MEMGLNSFTLLDEIFTFLSLCSRVVCEWSELSFEPVTDGFE